MPEYKSRTEKRQAKESARKTHKKRPLLKKVIISAMVALLVVIIAGIITAVTYIRDAPPLDADELVFSEGATIYDMNDQEVGRLQGTENRTYRDISEMPEHLKDAFIAIEDSRFYDHGGIDFYRVGGAIVANIREGFGAEGASTITQQLVKQAFLSTDQTMKRKVQEQWLALQMERQYSKDEILEMYLNIGYFDSGVWGVGEASIRYFDKEDLNELSIADAAVLAAIPRRPSYYNPESNPEAAEDRRDLVLSQMEDQELISSEEAQEAMEVNIEDQLNFTPANNDFAYQSFIDHVMEEVEDIDGIELADLYSSGFDIYTTIDMDAQDYAQAVVQSDDYISQYPDEEAFQVGFTLLDTQSGAIRALVGNRQESEAERGWNHATAASGQPGSTIKPLLDYGPAIENLQWSTGHQIVDAPHSYSDGTEIRNYTRSYSGSVSMREALVQSLNIPAVKTLQEVGLDDAQAFAEGLGLTFEDDIEESYALGGFREGVSSLDMAAAYAAFGNDGVYNEPHSVRKIVFRDGQEIELSPESERAMQDSTAYMITDMLKGVLTGAAGTGTRANVEGLPMAGKTGTSNFSAEEQQDYGFPEGAVPDIWFNGYTTRYTAAVWTGYEGPRSSGYLASGEEQQIAKDIFRQVMAHVHEGEETADFTRPDTVCGTGVLSICGANPSPTEDDLIEDDTPQEEPEEPIEEEPEEDESEEEEQPDESTEEEDPEEEQPDESTEEEDSEEEQPDESTEEEDSEEEQPDESTEEEDPEEEQPEEDQDESNDTEAPEDEESDESTDDPPDNDNSDSGNDDDGGADDDEGNSDNGDSESDDTED
ncbi:PBP1A family penicillin-binding protein [Virgibacillus sp. NKC19-3]|uniref:transglycosylase domain-containing protein n=1 Tax=Virgibacillus saliphilus TaxID=2831674 RepID=UPI001C9B87DD|nr:PBP1A family penicillin-binding protein [Virgibacillus sp. NKC19-3]MBY7141627.1 PBP1A family penicillin-binding protein [Virgibacillus sp. NKC19-3]